MSWPFWCGVAIHMGRRSDPRWRDSAAAELAAEVLPVEGQEGRALVAWDSTDAVTGALAGRGLEVHRWRRMDALADGRIEEGTAWPEGEGYRTVALRLPRSRVALRFALHAAASVSAPGAVLYVYGAKDEGIVSSASRIEPLFGPVETVATARRCRVLAARWDPEASRKEPLLGSLSEWRSVSRLDLGRGVEDWVTYPGTFAGDHVDPGTALLLRNLPKVSPGARVLDFGAGTGVIAATVARAASGIEVVLVEPDALARAAAAENVDGARFESVADWPDSGPYDLVVSNPPYHEGKAETMGPVEQLVRGSIRSLAPGGELRLVVQRRLPAGRILEAVFARVDAVADEGPYRVWSASAS